MFVLYFKAFSHHLLVPCICEHSVSLTEGLGSSLLEAEVAPNHAALKGGGISPGGCVCVCWVCGPGVTTEQLYKHTCTYFWQVFHKA